MCSFIVIILPACVVHAYTQENTSRSINISASDTAHQEEEPVVAAAAELMISEKKKGFLSKLEHAVTDISLVGLQRASTEAVQAISSILQCCLCLTEYTDPVTLSCGHTFCRHCLHHGLTVHKRACPQCRQPCFINAANAPVSVVVKNLCKQLDPLAYAEREILAADHLRSFSEALPVYFRRHHRFPGQKLNLHLVEPRYRLMMQRLKDVQPRVFAFVVPPPGSSRHWIPQSGDIGLLARVTEMKIFPDQRCFLTAIIESRFVISDCFCEADTEGLHYVKTSEKLEDEDEDVSASTFQTATKEAERLVDFVKEQQPDVGVGSTENTDYNGIPAPGGADGKYSTVKSMSAVSMWLSGFLLEELDMKLNKSALTELQSNLLKSRCATYRMNTLGFLFHIFVAIKRRRQARVLNQSANSPTVDLGILPFLFGDSPQFPSDSEEDGEEATSGEEEEEEGEEAGEPGGDEGAVPVEMITRYRSGSLVVSASAILGICVGSGFTLAVLGFRHGTSLQAIHR